MNLRNLKIGARLGFGFAAMLLLMVVIAGTGVLRLKNVGETTDEMVKHALVKERLASEWLSNLHSNTVANLAMIRTADPEVAAYFSNMQVEGSSRISRAQKELVPMLSSPEEKALYAAIAASRVVVLETVGKLNKLKDSGRLEEANALANTKFSEALEVYGNAVESLAKHQRSKIDESAKLISSDFRNGRAVLLMLSGIALILGALLAWRSTVGIVRPLRDAVMVAETVAVGDLSRSIDAWGRDEAGQLILALKNMSEGLARVVAEVREGTDSISRASGEIALGNQNLSSRTEEQASSLAQTAVSMGELTLTVKRNANNARRASQSAVSASEVALRGGHTVSRVVTAMDSINASSKKIEDITGVIDGIAFQTNILALNAAVEAARAGEQGRGFAVVAAEVRSLAQRSAAAAKEIKILIADSVSEVEEGSRQVEEAGRTMEEVVGSVRQVTSIMSEISTASHEQASGIEQINQAIMQMDMVTQQNSALVEQASAAAQSLQESAEGLVRAVSTFTLRMH
ncbi:HAMP domain-containing protein [Variovorax guangxiensis]|uniref:HAMP domain-containing protein n=1 Tax=Variovorax guangxiensis TaxID=1775474 RepID=A0A3S0Z8U6_9BURK|nr:methyl-accepting chemotaxis protein [Variovorax guangxiensis]RUR71285.1 HAMP domain-containing protein [Variovorax guangxiensis]